MPKLQELVKLNLLRNDEINDFESRFSKYLLKRYEKFLIIDTLVFPNKQTLFKSLYEPLTLLVEPIFDEDGEGILIDGYPMDLLPNYGRVIIEDTAGMGKSTIMRKLFLSIVEDKVGIPILIELRQLKNNNDIINEIKKQVSPIGLIFDDSLIYSLINEGGFIFLFDGFDEIPLANKEFVISELHSFIEKANYNNFLISSRPEDSLYSF
ncbi:NACHT domain-containing protein [Rufibacter immobilis]|uniref:NACHT domain-containing protein n=1 Tax=Rufibacter immobilis TaxID=1348778 RepID=UPI0035E8C978